MKKLLLASQSPRRKQLLEEAHLPFTVKSVSTTEDFPRNLNPEKAPEYIALGKAIAVWEQLSSSEKKQVIILSADTIVLLNQIIFGKPKDEKEAFNYLKSLSGKQHSVITGVCLLSEEKQVQFSSSTKVFFRELKEEQIRYYLQHFKPYDKAGAYAIQEWIGLIGIEKIEGDFYNVMGLPVGETIRALNENFQDLITF